MGRTHRDLHRWSGRRGDGPRRWGVAAP